MVNNKKSYATWKQKGYIHTPEISFIIQSHNKSREVIHIIEKLRAVKRAELIVIDDGSDPSHTKLLTQNLIHANEFLIRANDLYENIMYDKSIRFANGEFVALLQDDDDFTDLSWVDNAIKLLRKYDNMVILGGCGGFRFAVDEEKEKAISTPYTDKWEAFSFVHHVNRAPMWINKSLFTGKLKGIDHSFAPFQYDDYELCLRAWLEGLTVGWYNAHFKSLSPGGMRIWNNSFTAEQCERNSRKFMKCTVTKKRLLTNWLKTKTVSIKSANESSDY
ncbi:MAG: glycosyltransferase family 2 protein [Tannerellaceae bacterium]|nr:glycosyltransferase family 2 protein [Tannerellaceae bacterium]